MVSHLVAFGRKQIPFIALWMVVMGLTGCNHQRIYVQPGVAINSPLCARIACNSSHDHPFRSSQDKKIYILAVDRDNTVTFSGAMTGVAPFAEAAYITPGLHRLQLMYVHAGLEAYGVVLLEAKTGGAYMIHAQPAPYSIEFVVEDLQPPRSPVGLPEQSPSANSFPTRPDHSF